MTIVANTFSRYEAKGLREQLSNQIYNISPEDTPFVSMASKVQAEQTLFEWQTDSLASVDTSNKQIEGDDITSFPAVAATARVGNYTQISRKLLILSGTLEAVNKAGRKSELAYQLAKRGAELKRDIESICLMAQAGAAGAANTARATASLSSWVKTNVTTGASGGDPAYTSGVPSAVRTDGTTRTFTETVLKNVISQVWVSGGDLRILMLDSIQKQLASAFSGIATRSYDLSNVDPRPTAIIASADVYVSDFGALRIIANRFQRARDGWLLDPEYVGIAHLRPFQTMRLAKTGDAEKRMLLVEWGLKVNQEAALGLAADLGG